MAITWTGMDIRYRRVFTESVWVAMGQVMRAIGLLVGIRLLTSYVAPEIYGKYSLLVGLLALGTGVFCYPFLHAINRFFHEASRLGRVQQLRHEIKKLLMKSVSALAVIIIVTGYIFALILQSGTLITTLFLAILLIAETISAFETNFLTASRQQARYSSWVATEAWLKPCAALILIWIWQPSVDAILSGYIAGIALAFWLFCRSDIKSGRDIHVAGKPTEQSMVKQIISFSKPLFPLAMVGWVSSLGDRYIIGGLMNYKAVGIYAAAYAIALQPFLLAGGIVELTIRPLYFNAVSRREFKREKAIYKSWLAFIITICVAGLIIVTLYYELLTKILLGQEFNQASELIPYLSAGGGLLAVSQVLEKPFYAYLQTRYVLFIHLWGSVASVFLSMILVLAYGLKGAAVAVPLYYGIQCIIAIFFNRKINRKPI